MQPPISDPNSTPKSEGAGNSRELREWLGLMPADFLIYIALGMAGSFYFINDVRFEIAISIVALVTAIISCKIGMKPDEKISNAANIGKKYSYPLCFLILIGILWLNFAHWTVT